MKTRLRAVVAATAASALLLSGAVLATAPASAATGPVISGAQLAMTVNTIATAAPAVVKGNSIRLWDTGTTWPTIEPAEAQYNWAPLDANFVGVLQFSPVAAGRVPPTYSASAAPPDIRRARA